MAIFTQPNPPKKDSLPFNDPPPPAPAPAPAPAVAEFSPTQTAPPRAEPAHVPAPAAATAAVKESLIAADLTIEGKIEGAGHVRIAGKFKGDVNVEGDLTLERGAKLNGGVRAKKVIVSGDLEGNIESADRVELLDTGSLVGDLKAGSLTVAAGSRIRGNVECGWGDVVASAKPNGKRDGKNDADAA